MPPVKCPGPWDGRNSGEGGTETFERETWLDDRCGGKRCARSQFDILCCPGGGVAGEDEIGVVI